MYQIASMIRRTLHTRLLESLAEFPAVALLGPRQVGKTTLAKTALTGMTPPALYLDMELPSDLARLQEPELYLEQYRKRVCVKQSWPGQHPS